MTVRVDLIESAIAGALDKCGGELTRVGPAAWRLGLMNGRRFDVSAAVDAGREWLQLDADADAGIDEAVPWRALVLNGVLPGFARIALRQRGLRLRADVPLDRGDVLTGRIAGACSGFKDALAALGSELDAAGGAASPIARVTADSGSSAVPEGSAELAERCRESGWSVTERANGSLAVDLRCPRRFYQAVVEPAPTGGARVTADLIARGAISAASRRALGMHLLATTALVRFARPAAIDDYERAQVRLEVPFDTMPDVNDLNHALSAVSIGCSLAGDEARALQTEAVAARYVAFREKQ